MRELYIALSTSWQRHALFLLCYLSTQTILTKHMLTRQLLWVLREDAFANRTFKFSVHQLKVLCWNLDCHHSRLILGLGPLFYKNTRSLFEHIIQLNLTISIL